MTQGLSYIQGPTEPALRDLTLGEALREAAEDSPDQIALICGTPDPAARRQWTYAELYAEAEKTAHVLAALFEPGERVAIWAPNIPEWVMVEFGAAMAGVILVTVNPSFQAKEVEYVLNQSQAAGILTLREYRGNPMMQTVKSVMSQCPALREVIDLGEWDAFLENTAADDKPLPQVKPTDPVMIQYTSGTTGFPKGALLHHRGLVNNGAHTTHRMGVPRGASTVTMMPLFHTGGCVACVLGAVSARGTQVLVETFDPGLVLELIETYRCCAMLGVPTMLIAMLEHPSFAERDLSCVKTLCSGGSTVPAALVRRFEEGLGAKFTIVFGQTECSPVAAMTRPDDSTEDKAHTLGGPMPHVEIKIIDPQSGETVPQGVMGEFCTRGYHVMLEYFRNPEATAKTIDAEGWLHTGDLCAMDERGYTSVQGRLKDMIIRGGENIYPREIEELLYQHPGIASVAVVGLPDEKYGEVVAAVIQPASGQTPDQAMLFAYLRENLSPQKTPSLWYRVEEFPLTGSGKIQKFKLREMHAASELQPLN